MVESSAKSRTLFDQLTEPVTAQNPALERPEVKPIITEPAPVEAKEVISSPPPTEKKIADNIIKDQFFSPEKPVERLIVFFKDQTFKVYYPSL
jgi:hypothetical protein